MLLCKQLDNYFLCTIFFLKNISLWKLAGSSFVVEILKMKSKSLELSENQTWDEIIS